MNVCRTTSTTPMTASGRRWRCGHEDVIVERASRQLSERWYGSARRAHGRGRPRAAAEASRVDAGALRNQWGGEFRELGRQALARRYHFEVRLGARGRNVEAAEPGRSGG